VYGLTAVSLRAHCLIKSCELISLQKLLHYVMVHAIFDTSAARKTLTAIKASRSNYYSLNTAETSGTRSHPLHQTLRVHTWRSLQLSHLVLLILLAVLPPSSSTYPHGGRLPPRHLVFQPLPVFLRHSHLCCPPMSTTSLAA